MEKRTHKFWQISFFVYCVIILVIIVLAYLRLIPVEIKAIPYYDTLGHFILLGMMAFLADQALRRKEIFSVPFGPALVVVFAVIEEFLQTISPYRTFSWTDMAANIIGISIFSWLGRKLHRGKKEVHP